LGVALPAGFPLTGWTSYKLIIENDPEVQEQCTTALKDYKCQLNSAGSYVVPAGVGTNNLCVRVAMGAADNWKTCFPDGINAAAGAVGAAC
jgi:hypothetical protein